MVDFLTAVLSDTQFNEFMAITYIIERRIRTNGAFVEPLRDYAYAIARSSNLDPVRAETTIRDFFKIRTGQTMNQLREELAERESKLTRSQTGLAYDFAIATGKMIEEGDKISFNRAFSHQAGLLASHLNVTEACAKRLIREEFKAAEADLDFDEWGKDIEQRFYRPQIEAERQKSEDRSRDDDRNPERAYAHDESHDEKPRRQGPGNGADGKTGSGFRRGAPGPRR